MSMPESGQHEPHSAQIIAVRFRMTASVEEVVARLLEAIRPIDVSLLKVFGDENHLYPFEGRNPARTASSWRAEFYWGASVRLQDFLGRAELSLGCLGGVWLEAGERRQSLPGKVGG